MKKIFALIVTLATPLTANALNIFVCEPEWGALIREIAGDDA